MSRCIQQRGWEAECIFSADNGFFPLKARQLGTQASLPSEEKERDSPCAFPLPSFIATGALRPGGKDRPGGGPYVIKFCSSGTRANLAADMIAGS